MASKCYISHFAANMKPVRQMSKECLMQSTDSVMTETPTNVYSKGFIQTF